MYDEYEHSIGRGNPFGYISLLLPSKIPTTVDFYSKINQPSQRFFFVVGFFCLFLNVR